MARFSAWVQVHKIDFGIFFAAFLVRALYALIVWLHTGDHGFVSFADAYYFYLREATNLIQGHGFSIASKAPFYPGSYHTPAYPLFLASLFYLKFTLFSVILVQDVLSGIICALFYRMALTLTQSRGIALFTGILAAFEPMSIYWSGLLMSDTLFAFFMVLSFYFLVEKKLVPTAFALGFAALTRPIALYLMPAYVIFVAYLTFTNTKNSRPAWINAALVLVLFFAIISPWLVRNKITFNTWQLSSASWYNIYITDIKTFSIDYGIPWPDVKNPDILYTDMRRFNFDYMPPYKAASLSVIRQNPADYVVFETARTLRAVFSSKYQYIPNQVMRTELPSIYERYHGLLMFFAGIGDFLWIFAYVFVIAAFTDQRLRPWWCFFVALMCINFVLSGMINPWGPDMTRYSIPFQGFVFSFAALGAGILWEKASTWKSKKGSILR